MNSSIFTSSEIFLLETIFCAGFVYCGDGSNKRGGCSVSRVRYFQYGGNKASFNPVLEVANTVLWLMMKYSIAMHGSAWHCSIAKDAGGKDFCSNLVRVLYRSATSGQARCTTNREKKPIKLRRDLTANMVFAFICGECRDLVKLCTMVSGLTD